MSFDQAQYRGLNAWKYTDTDQATPNVENELQQDLDRNN